jgi:urea carboxylase
VSPFYDPLVAKILVHAPDRDSAIAKMESALAETRVEGIETNRDYLRQIIASPEFRRGDVWTGFLKGFAYRPRTIDVLDGGTQTTIQDFPGRVGYWAVGVPPSGPMDALAFRLANRLLGNPATAAGIEMTMNGATLRFNAPATVCLAGAKMKAKLAGQPVSYWKPFRVAAGQTLSIGAIDGAGCRTYLAVRGGMDVPEYLDSRATFTLGQYGGHAGRALRVGDVLKLSEDVAAAEWDSNAPAIPAIELAAPPENSNYW